MLLATYYAQNYAGIIGWSLDEASGLIVVASKGYMPAFWNPDLIFSG